MVDLLELVEPFQFPGPNGRLVSAYLHAFHALEVRDQGRELAGLLVGVVVADVLVDLSARGHAQLDAPGRDLLHDQDVDEVLPRGSVGAALGPRTAVLRRHGLGQQLIRIILWGQFDHVTATVSLPAGQDLEQRALSDPPAADQDPLCARLDPAVCLGLHEVLIKAALDITLGSRRSEVDLRKRSLRKTDTYHDHSSYSRSCELSNRIDPRIRGPATAR